MLELGQERWGGCAGTTFPDLMIHGVLGHDLDAGKSPDAQSVATPGSWVGSEKN